MKYYISDLHFGHENIIRLCNRPFSSVREMDKALIDNWNSVVKPNDEVYILGDIVFRSANNPIDYFKQLNGKKYLITGNHDNPKPEWYSYFEKIKPDYFVVDNGRKIKMYHYPVVEWDGYFRGTISLYGHTHNNTTNPAYKIMRDIPNAYNVGADILGFTPRTLDQVIECNKKFNATHKI